MLTDGDLADEDRLRRLVEGLGGTSTDRVIALPDGAEAHAPRFDRAPTWREPITLDAWRWADGASDIMVKQVLIGPYTMARLADPGGAPREVLALASAEALNAELHALAGGRLPGHPDRRGRPDGDRRRRGASGSSMPRPSAGSPPGWRSTT